MAKKKGLTVRELVRISHIIGKKNPDGSVVTEKDVLLWPSVKGKAK